MSDVRLPDINEVMLAGRLTRDPELKYLPSGTALCNMSLAYANKWKTKSGEQKEDRLFCDVECWGKVAEFAAENLHKGSPVIVKGSLKMDEWEDKKTGAKRSKKSIKALRVEALEWGEPKKEQSTDHLHSSSAPIPEDGIPF